MTLHLSAISVGSGDPNHITLQVHKRLQAAQLIFALRTEQTGATIALDIARPHLDTSKQVIVPIDVQRGRRAGERDDLWQFVAETIVERMKTYASEHSENDHVIGAFLQLGDATLYGTFDYLRARLPDEVIFDVLPGVTSFAATAARLGVSLAGIDERVCILPAAYEDDATIRQAITDYDTVILLKTGFVRGRILALLQEMNVLANTIYAENVGLPDERIVRDATTLLAEDTDKRAPYLTMMIVRS
ncbi:MAG: precorrin-2 C(20)-methyltransferase [Chloroflexota bacterium]